ncbi:MAG: hypothetical protein D6715_05650 [Calditrichaeota bacterium]|nr:MAG: hypothetical protein D6715_05650 [Calditrichota bacterium]
MKTFHCVVTILAFTILVGCDTSNQQQVSGPAPMDSLAMFREVMKPAENCKPCHPTHYQEWQSSMHAYAFVDPVFFRLNDIGQQRSSNQLDQFCVKCHSPFATFLQEAPPGFDPANLSDLAARGVQCDVCHTIKSFQAGKSVETFHLDGVRRGPLSDPKANAFHESAFDQRYTSTEICTPCHNVIAPNGLMVESTAEEWNQSPYLAMGLECQGCHMPTYSGEAAVGGPMRDNLHRHTFVGVDYPLVDFPGKEQTIQAVRELLQKSLKMTVEAPATANRSDSLTIQVTLLNDQTGHDIPSGTIFERQMWVEITVTDQATGQVVYQSGLLDPNGDLLNHHSEYVANGSLPEDSTLALFHGTPFTAGSETLFFWEADAVEKKTIPPFDSRTVTYRIAPPLPQGPLTVNVRLRFRSFPPYLLRAIGMESLIDKLIIFDMAEFQQTIQING